VCNGSLELLLALCADTGRTAAQSELAANHANFWIAADGRSRLLPMDTAGSGADQLVSEFLPSSAAPALAANSFNFSVIVSSLNKPARNNHPPLEVAKIVRS